MAYSKYFNASYDAPDAIVILNRGSAFEKDITKHVMSFNCSYSVQGISSSFNLTLANINDELVDRFGFTQVKKMSSIEIFGKSSLDKFEQDNVYDTNNIPKNGKDGHPINSIQAFAIDYYGNVPDIEEYCAKIKKLNSNIVIPQSCFDVKRYTALSNPSYNVSDVRYQSATGTQSYGNIIIVFKDGSRKTIAVKTLLSKQNVQGQVAPSIPEGDGITSCYFVPVNAQDILGDAKVNHFIVKDVYPRRTSLQEIFEESGSQLNDEIYNIAIKMPRPKNLYKRIFLGVITSISQAIAPGSAMSLSVTGKSFGYWMEASSINVSPAGLEIGLTGQDLTNYANKYAETHAIEIFKDLISFSTDNIIATSTYDLNELSNAAETLVLLGETIPQIDQYGNVQPGENVKDTTQDGKDLSGATSKQRFLNQYNDRSKARYNGKEFQSGAMTTDPTWKSLGLQYTALENKAKINTANLAKYQAKAVPSPSESKSIQELSKQIEQETSEMNSIAEKIDALDVVKFDQQKANLQKNKIEKELAKYKVAGREAFLDIFGITSHWKQIFAKIVLEVIDDNFLSLVYPFRWDIRSPNFFEGDYQTRASIAQAVADAIQYEFYCDTNGHFVLKPPLFSVDPAVDNPTYIIEESDITNMSITDTVDGIITRIGVAGDYVYSQGLEKSMIYSAFQDMNLIRDFGYYYREVQNMFFLHSIPDCRDFGRAYMARNNMELVNGSVTIIGRPELRLGTSVYIKPRDMVFYIKDISHEFSVGDQFTTTLTLVGGRRIISGFKAQKKVTLVERVTSQEPKDKQKPGSPPYTYTDHIVNGGEAVITHYVPTYLTNFEVRETNQQVDTAPLLLKSKIIITNHDNPAYIGLIVDGDTQQSNIAGDCGSPSQNVIYNINYKNFRSFYGIDKDKIESKADQLAVPKDYIDSAIAIIQQSIVSYLNSVPKSGPYAQTTLEINQVGGTQPEQVAGIYFSLSKMNEYILIFLKQTKDFIDSNISIANSSNMVSYDLLNGASTLGKDARQSIIAAVQIFNSIIQDIDNNGSYRDYTDEFGRELPVYLNFGKSLILENTNMSIEKFKNILETQKKLSGGKTTKQTVKKNTKSQDKAAKITMQGVKSSPQNTSPLIGNSKSSSVVDATGDTTVANVPTITPLPIK
jgi:hypothetical protein